MKITDVKLYPVKVPVRLIKDGGIAPYAGSKDPPGKGTTYITSCIYRIDTDEGLSGWGEMNAIISQGLTKSLLDDYLKPKLVGKDPFEHGKIMKAFDNLYNPDVNTKHFASAVEMALWDLMGKACGKPVCDLLGGPVREEVPIAYAMGIMPLEATKEKIRQVKEEGFTAIKTKGGLDVRFDIERTRLIRDLGGFDLSLRVDMNQGYQLPEALCYCKGVDDCGLQYVEQPLPANRLWDYASLRGRTTVPIAINEDCYIPGNLAAAVKIGAVDAAVADLESSGGVSELVKLGHYAELAGLAVAHHCAWDLGLKLAAILQCVSTLGAFSLPMDSTYTAHDGDILAEPIRAENGCYRVPKKPGLGVDVDEEKLQFYAHIDPKAYFVF